MCTKIIAFALLPRLFYTDTSTRSRDFDAGAIDLELEAPSRVPSRAPRIQLQIERTHDADLAPTITQDEKDMRLVSKSSDADLVKECDALPPHLKPVTSMSVARDDTLLEKSMPLVVKEWYNDEDFWLCKICWDKKADTVFLGCGHQCACTSCAKTLSKLERPNLAHRSFAARSLKLPVKPRALCPVCCVPIKKTVSPLKVPKGLRVFRV